MQYGILKLNYAFLNNNREMHGVNIVLRNFFHITAILRQTKARESELCPNLIEYVQVLFTVGL